MCLSYLKNFKTKDNVGWKVFKKINKKLYPVFTGIHGVHNELEEDKWLFSEDYKKVKLEVLINVNLSHIPKKVFYDSGFHIYKVKKDAENLLKFFKAQKRSFPELYEGETFVVKKVIYEEVLAKGYEGQRKPELVIVANKMKILNKKEN